MKVFVVVLAHVIGGIAAMIIHYKNGMFEWSSHNGDGIRWARPSDIVFGDLVLWEIQLLIFAFDAIETSINNLFEKKFNK